MSAHIRSFEEAREYLGAKDGRPVANNTRVERREGGAIAIRLHGTDVVTYRPDGSAVLNTGSWRTVTTKDRINTYAPAGVRVYSDRGAWKLYREGQVVCRFEDGLIVDASGRPVNAPQDEPSAAEIQRKVDRAVRAYIKGYAAAMAAGEIPQPGNGDCWGCLFHDTRDAEQAKPREGGWRQVATPTPHGRREPMGLSHYIEHIGLGEEGAAEVYHVPSLLWNAITAARYGDPRYVASMIWGRRDGEWTARVLRGYFRKLKPALVAELSGRQEREEVAR